MFFRIETRRPFSRGKLLQEYASLFWQERDDFLKRPDVIGIPSLPSLERVNPSLFRIKPVHGQASAQPARLDAVQ